VFEPTFAPRHADAPEADGYLILPLSRFMENLSEFLIFDTQDISGGPIARIELPFQIGWTLTGTGWISAWISPRRPQCPPPPRLSRSANAVCADGTYRSRSTGKSAACSEPAYAFLDLDRTERYTADHLRRAVGRLS